VWDAFELMVPRLYSRGRYSHGNNNVGASLFDPLE